MRRIDDWHAAFAAARSATHEAIDGLGTDRLRRQPHSEFSPIGWHYGHIAYTEALWLLVKDSGDGMPAPNLAALFPVDAVVKHERGDIVPSREQLDAFAAEVRRRVLARIDDGAPLRNPRLWHFVLQHECQHCETMTTLRWMTGADRTVAADGVATGGSVAVPDGTIRPGADGDIALDNERGADVVDLDGFRIDRHPVTQGAFRAFIEAGGYDDPSFWSEDGWRWRVESGADRPLYWIDGRDALPVAGVNRHEAEAYCAFRGGRLPTEAEWERAARWDPATNALRAYPWGAADPSPAHAYFDRRDGGPSPVGDRPDGRSAIGCEDLLGNVWEWTADCFEGYPRFEPFPYSGYSQAYFDGRHYVVKGGSWATRAPVLRPTFRNWYMPHIRQILVGFRCVGGVA